MELNTLKDLFIHELKDLYSAESQIIKALPKIIKQVSSEELQEALQNHLEETEGQINRLARWAQFEPGLEVQRVGLAAWVLELG